MSEGTKPNPNSTFTILDDAPETPTTDNNFHVPDSLKNIQGEAPKDVKPPEGTSTQEPETQQAQADGSTGKKPEDFVPYDRFKSVNDEKKFLGEKVSFLEEQLNRLQIPNTQTKSPEEEISIEYAEDAAKYIKNLSNEIRDLKAKYASLETGHQHMNRMTFESGRDMALEKAFIKYPDAKDFSQDIKNAIDNQMRSDAERRVPFKPERYYQLAFERAEFYQGVIGRHKGNSAGQQKAAETIQKNRETVPSTPPQGAQGAQTLPPPANLKESHQVFERLMNERM